MPAPGRYLTAIATVAWLLVVVGGFAGWEAYESTPGARSAEPAPRSAKTTLGWELDVFLHPNCSCSSATIGELEELIAAAPLEFGVRVVFVCPPEAPDGWERTELWSAATGLPGVRVECDRRAEIARRGGATTSGHAVLSDPAGRVVFRGGLTRGRGRVGESAGRRAILSLLAGEEPETRAAPVFGCSLF